LNELPESTLHVRCVGGDAAVAYASFTRMESTSLPTPAMVKTSSSALIVPVVQSSVTVVAPPAATHQRAGTVLPALLKPALEYP